MLTKYTPGPWITEQEENEGLLVLSDKSNYRICTIETNGNRGKKQDLANANLIASAPVLLEALRSLILHDRASDNRSGLPECLELQHAEDTINKVEGR